MEMPGETQVYLHLHSSIRHPVHLNAGVQNPLYNVRVSARRQTVSEPDPSKVQLKVLRKYECFEAKGDDNNEWFQENDFFSYSTDSTDISTLGFIIYVFSKVESDSKPTYLGQGNITPLQLIGTNGTLIVSLTNKSFQAVGSISVDYLLVKPWCHALNIPSGQCRRSRGIDGQKMDGSYLCGHRGAGVSFGASMPSKYPENTICAFKAGHEMGMDFVEMDVQVSKDKVAVIFHDRVVKICFEMSSTYKSKSTYFDIPVQDLTVEQLKAAKVWEWSESVAKQKLMNSGLDRKHEDDDAIKSSTSTPDATDYGLFPTLEEALVEVPQEVGFLIELKYPLQEMHGESIDKLCMDKNQFVDSILQAVFEKAGERKVILGSFDPDLCTMCQSKQSKYPVLIIAQGINSLWDPYMDLRARSIATSVAFAKSQNLDGIHLLSSLLLDSPETVEKVLEADLTLSAWGEENNKAETKKWLVEHGVHCIQVDKYV